MSKRTGKVHVEEVMMMSQQHITEPSDFFHSQINYSEISLSWEKIKLKCGNTKILRNLSGIAKPGQLSAIIGASGCGKTSLLNFLSRRPFAFSNFQSSGIVKINSKPMTSTSASNHLKSVMVDSLLLESLTPYEVLSFSARFKFSISNMEIDLKIAEILQKFKIENVAHCLIGGKSSRGLSGGEKKRLSIGLEMISDPSILILDEPTSGLDSSSALSIVQILRDYCNAGKTILMTIHQPGQDIYGMIDTLMLMTQGRFMFQGPRTDVEHYFKTIGFEVSDRFSSGDYFFRVLSSKMLKIPGNLKKIINSYKELEKNIDFNTNTEPLRMPNLNFRPSRFEVLLLCIKKSLILAKRNPLLLKVNVAHAVLVSIFLGMLYFNLGHDREGVENRKGLLFFVSVNTLMFGCMSNALIFPVERTLFLKEHSEGLYGVFPYFLSKMIAGALEGMILNLMNSIFTYFATSLSLTAGHYLTFLFIQILIHFVGMSFGFLSGILAFNEETAAAIGYSSTSTLMLFGGYFCKKENLNKAFRWISFMTPYTYAYEAFVINEFRDFEVDHKEYGESSPLEEIGVKGEIWEKCGGLIIIYLILSVLSLSSLKLYTLRKGINFY